jgi:hypothetical protein
MGLHKLAMTIGCLVLFGAAFGVAFVFLRISSHTDTQLTTTPQALTDAHQDDKATNDAAKDIADDPTATSKTKTKTSKENAKPAKTVRTTPTDKKPITCAEATKQGSECVGQRVTWVAKWTLSQSAPVDRQKGAQHIFYTQGPNGDYTFDYPFVAEDPKPLELSKKGEDIRADHARKWGPTGIVTVTGTITSVRTLILIGQGTRYNVPVLSDIKITINP